MPVVTRRQSKFTPLDESSNTNIDNELENVATATPLKSKTPRTGKKSVKKALKDLTNEQSIAIDADLTAKFESTLVIDQNKKTETENKSEEIVTESTKLISKPQEVEAPAQAPQASLLSLQKGHFKFIYDQFGEQVDIQPIVNKPVPVAQEEEEEYDDEEEEQEEEGEGEDFALASEDDEIIQSIERMPLAPNVDLDSLKVQQKKNDGWLASGTISNYVKSIKL